MKIPEKHWDTILSALWCLEDSDNTLSQNQAREADETREWFVRNVDFE